MNVITWRKYNIHHKAARFFLHWIVPHQHNNWHPHILRRGFLHGLSVTLLSLKSLLLVFLFALYPSSAQFSTITSARVIELVNTERKAAGLEVLKNNQFLERAAYFKGEDMLKGQYFSHTSHLGVTPWEWFKKVGYHYTYAGENLAMNFITADDAVRAWMESALHRENIMNRNYKDIGIAVLQGKLQGTPTTILVQLFGTTYAQQKEILTEEARSGSFVENAEVAGVSQIEGGKITVELIKSHPQSFISGVISLLPRISLTGGLLILVSLFLLTAQRLRKHHAPIVSHALLVIAVAVLVYFSHIHFIESIPLKELMIR